MKSYLVWITALILFISIGVGSIIPVETINIVRSATEVVAAYNSSPQSKAQADYLCDGIDDQLEIQTAINALPANGGMVKLLEGNYSVAGNGVDVNDVNIHIGGTGWGTIIELAAGQANDDAALTVSADHVQVSDLQIDGNRVAQDNAIRQPGLRVTSDYVTVTGLYISQTVEHSISLEGANHCIVTGNYCSNFGDDGISINPDGALNVCSFITVSNNICRDALGPTSSGVEIQDGCTDVSVVGNLFYNLGILGAPGGGAGVSIGAHIGSPAVERVSVIANQFGADYPEYFMNSGISISGGGGRTVDVTITGNALGKAIYGQALFIANCDRIIVSDNTMGWTVNSVVYIHDATNIIFSNNILYDIRTKSMKMMRIENSSYVRVIGNIIDGNSHCNYGVAEEGTASNNYYSDNVIRNCAVATLLLR